MRTSVALAAAGTRTSDHLDVERRRATRFSERHNLWRVSQVRKLRTCGRGVRDGQVDVLVATDAKGNRRGAAHGLVTCSSVWACPVCSEHIRTARGDEVQRAFEAWTDAGGGLVMVTLTIRHNRTQSLRHLMDALATSWRRIQQRRGSCGTPWA